VTAAPFDQDQDAGCVQARIQKKNRRSVPSSPAYRTYSLASPVILTCGRGKRA